MRLAGLDALGAGDRRQGEGDVGQHVEQVALLGVDQAADDGELVGAIALVGQALQQRLARVGLAPEPAQLVLVLEQLGQRAEQLGR